MISMFTPAYLKLYEKGGFDERIRRANAILQDCTLCPRNCRVNRLQGELGVCKTGRRPVVSSYGPHFGEESPLVGSGGSGTIFITHCNLLCIFCQNHDISHLGRGEELAIEGLTELMLRIQNQGCHNINFVTPTHVVPMILEALPPAVERGLDIPLVYNSSGYDKAESIKLLDGIFDIYMPDFKFWDRESSQKYLDAADYPKRAKDAIREMHRQVGDLKIDSRGIAQRGLLVRHLVMPENLANTQKVMHFIHEEISPHTYVNIMPQYRPCFEADRFPELNRPVTKEEFNAALRMAREEEITRLDNRDRTFLVW